MSSTAKGPKTPGRYAVERGLAPHVEETWAENLILELRLLGVEGSRIGEALSEVESHCSESGESGQEAFGDPAEFAQSLGLPLIADETAPSEFGPLVPVAVQMLGMSLVNWGFEDWLAGRPLDLTVGHFVTVAITLVGIVALIRFLDPLMRSAIQRPKRTSVALALVLMGNTAVCVAALIFLDTVIWRVPAGWALATGTAVLAAAVGWAFAMRSKDDLITSPLTKPDSTPSDAPGRLAGVFESHLGTLICTAMIPVGTVFLLATTLLLHLMAAT